MAKTAVQTAKVSSTRAANSDSRSASMTSKLEKSRTLAGWIRKGWNHPESEKFKHRYLLYDNGGVEIILYTFGFALLGKEGSIEAGGSALKEALKLTDNVIDAIAKALGSPIGLIRKVEYLDGRYGRMTPLEIAQVLEKGEV